MKAYLPRQIAEALSAGDVQALAALAIELTSALAGAEATLAQLRAADDERREKQAGRKRRQRERETEGNVTDSHVTARDFTSGHVTERDVTAEDGTGRDVTFSPPPPSPSLLSPTPPNNPSSPTSPPSPPPPRARSPQKGEGVVSRDRLLAKFTDDRNRASVAEFLDGAQLTGKSVEFWVDEIAGWFDGLNMPRLQPAVEGDVGQGIRDYLAEVGRDYMPNHVRTFPVSAMRARLKRDTPESARQGPRRSLSITERGLRQQREEEIQSRVKVVWPNVQRRRDDFEDGQAWWSRMQREAATAEANAFIYAADRLHEGAEPGGMRNAS